MEAVAIMAKKRRASFKKPKEMVLGVRGSDEWKAWLDEMAEFSRLNKVDVVDLALVDYAIKIGFRPPPKR